MNDDQISTLDMFQLLREDIKASEARTREDIKASEARIQADMQKQFSDMQQQFSAVRSDIQGLDERLRKVEEAVAGKKAVATFQKTLMDWVFRIAAAVGVGGAIKAFFS